MPTTKNPNRFDTAALGKMADISITPASVVPSANATLARGVAGASISAGDVLYRDPTDGTMKLADANGASPLYVVAGIAACSAATGQPLLYVTQDSQLAIGGTVAAGSVVILSATAGKTAPAADAATGMFVTVLGVGIGSNKINFTPVAAGVAAP